jgi:hypothetical protein
MQGQLATILAEVVCGQGAMWRVVYVGPAKCVLDFVHMVLTCCSYYTELKICSLMLWIAFTSLT